MKRLLCILLIFVILLLTGCNQAPPEPIEAPTETEEIEETNFRKPASVYSQDFLKEGSFVTVDILYRSFEEALDDATHIVKATYIETYDYGGHCEYKFSVQSQIKGKISEKIIYVYSTYYEWIGTTGGGYYANEIKYTPGNDYILILLKGVSVYYDHDRYGNVCDTFLPVDAPEKMAIYAKQPLSDHSSAPAETFSSVENILDYIKNRFP